MSRKIGGMSDFIMDIQEDILDGLMTFQEIAMKWNCPVSWVYEAERMLDRQMDEPDPGDMDGDAVSALASIGWGTDEDYGYSGDE